MTIESASLAANLIGLRREKGWSQKALAQACGLPRSTVATLESGGANPTLHVLLALGRTLQWSIEELLAPVHEGVRIFGSDQRPKPKKSTLGGVMTSLLPRRLPGVEFDQIVLQAGDRFQGSPHKHGTQEFLFVSSGAIGLWVAGEKVVVPKGCTAAFEGDQRHTYTSESRGRSVGYSVVFVSHESNSERHRA